MLTVDKLRDYGADVEDGLKRCLNNETFYLTMVSKAMQDTTPYDRLAEALAENDLDRAFETAHALKGVLGNLSLTPLFNPVAQTSDLLKARTKTDYSGLLAEIIRKKDELVSLIG